jgi:CRP/FNR family transcriptional regulator, cyclic AMP receptor protein
MNSGQEILDDIRALPCLSGFGKDDLFTIGEMTKIKEIGRNEAVFEEAEPAKFFFVLKTGTIKLYKTSQEGRELIIKIMGPGDYFCCAPLCSGGSYMVRAIALEDSTLITIPSQTFMTVLRSTVSETGWRIILGLCNKIHYLSRRLEDLAFKDVEKRVIATLLTLSGQIHQEDDFISLQVSHQDVASMTGTVREVVSRTMSKLKKEGVITHTSVKGFTIDRGRLSKLAGRLSSVPSLRL